MSGSMAEAKGPTKTLEVRGRRFEYLSTRAYDPTEVYQSGSAYLRIGPAKLISKELALQRMLLKKGFPVAEIMDSGRLGKQQFYIEKSLGKVVLRHVFASDHSRYGRVLEKNFSVYLKLTERFANAQLSTISRAHANGFDKSMNLVDLMIEFPEMAGLISEAFRKAKSRISRFPLVLCHGDLNVSNFLPKGIIDFEWAFWGYAGFDVIGNIYFTYFFPKVKRDRSARVYEPTEGQIAKYLDAMDLIYERHGLQRPSDYKDDFMYPKAVWAASKMGKYPGMQRWRFDLLRQITNEYLDGKPIVETIRSFPS